MSALFGWLTVAALAVAWPWLTRLARAIDVAQRRREATWRSDDLAALKRLHERLNGRAGQ